MVISKKVLVSFILIINFNLFADEFHYQDLIVGERAAGLAGAYISIADDPSGLYHNPAGIIYNFENYFSLSANVYKTSKTTYKKALAGQDYVKQSSGWVPNFFGATQNFGKLKYGFAILSPSTEVIDQDDNINNISSTYGQPNSLRRRLMRQYSVSLYGIGLAYEPVKDLAAGASFFLGQFTDKTVSTILQINNDASNDYYVFNEAFDDKNALFFYPKFGLQWMPAPKWAVGAVAATSYTFYSKQKIRTLQSTSTAGGANDSANLKTSESTSKPNMISPYELGLGVSFFPTKSLLFSFDMKYFTDDPSFTNFTTIPVLNFSFGTEWYVNDKIVLRGGVYNNDANTPLLKTNKSKQKDHVDYLGMTAGITFESTGSSFTLCTQLSQGKGKGQVVNDESAQQAIQDIEATSAAIYITASYQL